MAPEIASCRGAAARRRRAAAPGGSWRALAAGACVWLFTSLPALAGLTSGEIRELEVLLARLGFNPGAVDGVVDTRTIFAIRGYQVFAALPIDGKASPALLLELRSVVATLVALKAEPSGEVESGPDPAPETRAKPEPVPTPEVAAPEPAPPPEPTPEPAVVESTSAAVSEAPPPPEVRLASTRSDEPEPTPDPAEAATDNGNQAGPAAADTGDGIEEVKRGFAVQLATMSSAEGAWREWARLKETLPELLADMPPKVTWLDRSDGGVFYLVLTGPLPDRAAAADLCAVVQAFGQDCLPVSGRLLETGLVEPPDPPPPAPAAQVEAQPEPAAPAPAVQTAALPGAGRASFVRAGETFMNGDCQGAVWLYTSALELGGLTPKDSAKAYNNRGRCHFTRARYDEALADHSAAIELHPEFAAAYFNRGRAYQAKGERSLAEADLDRAYDLGFRRLGSLGAAEE